MKLARPWAFRPSFIDRIAGDATMPDGQLLNLSRVLDVAAKIAESRQSPVAGSIQPLKNVSISLGSSGLT